MLSTIPACVWFGAVAGLILLNGRASQDAIFPTIGSVVIGALFGWASE